MNQFETLTQINLDGDLVSSFGWQGHPLHAKILRFLFRKPAETFARHMMEYDDTTGGRGIALSIDFESFQKEGFLLGHASVLSIPLDFPMLDYLEHLFAFTAMESCGKCFPCRIGSTRGKELSQGVRDGRRSTARSSTTSSRPWRSVRCARSVVGFRSVCATRSSTSLTSSAPPSPDRGQR